MNAVDYFGGWWKIINSKELNILINKINKLYKTTAVCPEYHNIFKAFELCNYDNLKVIFLGQDPYPQRGVATGLAFANKKTSTILSPSLNVLKESAINFEIPHNCCTFDPTLEEWSKQGVLLLNSALTVELNKPGSHSVLWRPFIICLLKRLAEWNPGLIYVLFGNSAKSFSSYIDKNGIILRENHPSFYARNNAKMPSKLFEDLDKATLYHFGTKINWYNTINL